jgi:hypothetical protein
MMQVGQSATITAGGFNPAESVGVTLHSTPQALTPATAGSAGAVTYNFTVPSGLADGPHSVVFVGNTSAVTQTFAFTLGSPTASPTASVLGDQVAGAAAVSLPFTGASIGRPLLFAIAALWSGFVLVLLSRRGGLVVVSSAGGGGSHRRNTLAAAHSTMTAARRGRHRSTGPGHRAR